MILCVEFFQPVGAMINKSEPWLQRFTTKDGWSIDEPAQGRIELRHARFENPITITGVPYALTMNDAKIEEAALAEAKKVEDELRRREEIANAPKVDLADEQSKQLRAASIAGVVAKKTRAKK